MNQQDQIGIIKAHMAGKRVLSRYGTSGEGNDAPWVPVTRGEFRFNFMDFAYKIEPRKLELFMALPSGVLQALMRGNHTAPPAAAYSTYVGNEPPRMLQPGHVIVKIHCTEPEN